MTKLEIFKNYICKNKYLDVAAAEGVYEFIDSFQDFEIIIKKIKESVRKQLIYYEENRLYGFKNNWAEIYIFYWNEVTCLYDFKDENLYNTKSEAYKFYITECLNNFIEYYDI